MIYGAAFSFRQSGRITDFPEFNFIEGKTTKLILGYECKQLFVSFRGRDYEIYYSPDLESYKDGPWKFMGAPGLILEVTSFTGAVVMKAKYIEFSTKLQVVEEPLEWRDRPQQIYSQFVDRRSTWREKVKAKIRAEDPMSDISIPYRNFEIYLPYYVDNHR
ncbi:GLPGLI family protein [Nonlabens mediterrranea]|uniref:GLPGLI family protein n=1 Tax=Nonlabens mediterrranea TaxID=1419947 RepID=A0ABS0A0T5_9FLAO|nr:GLPGLI family protein [Nonlabens mediterrranea]